MSIIMYVVVATRIRKSITKYSIGNTPSDFTISEGKISIKMFDPPEKLFPLRATAYRF